MIAFVYDKNHPDKLVRKNIEQQSSKEEEVLVKIYAVSLNAADYRSMKMGIIPKRKIFGADIAGRVEAIGSKVRNLKVGDDVYGDISGCGFGGFAEYVAVPEGVLARKPKGITYEMAAALPMASVTALQAIRNKGEMKQGDKVLICGAGGGVGYFAVQLAKYFGAEVTAVCSENNTILIQELGADHIINYKLQDFSTEGKRYDLVIGINGDYLMSSYRKVMASGSRFILVGGSLSQMLRFLISKLFLFMGRRRLHFLAAKPNTKDLELVMKLVETGQLKIVLDRTYPFEQTAEAMKYISKGHARGKVVIRVVN
ncbi:MAG: Zn-dependent oxidoreductase, NADPH:quinone reductase [Herbinix sp.]|jgi:NADPH:quinone reductase-like Zn-dependent oxidoreductase|nr:Zn-dependent oxidoreductase, NADPH:quinone reductase [Herbinix sp.]